jgi:hypothetical protein
MITEPVPDPPQDTPQPADHANPRELLSRPHGVAPATRRRGVRRGRGHATDIADDGTTIPGHAGDLPVPAGLGSDIHHSPPPDREFGGDEPAPF